ncbi:sigma-70 family RNA polymerase sigma factor [Mesorhizobium sp. L-8-3]|uniref:sigma-70 family RNA polymerase sigma factor n=1 Tax=Mesorhizobium sp. L-8-3 TaxID=2744522 RepID=UPI0019263A55|nr:sigma-70 family RNA polymerase sigma factor [Mesorhizobium sp. L-8-3]BCH23313.1 RNA polymerase sigma factor SigJ [Mesorhizobium sp. L-8-3]
MNGLPLAEFEKYRSAMFGIAYRMLGSVSDAEDILQDAYLRWHDADRREVESPRAFLSSIVTRLCLDRLRKVRRQREDYVGQWLPEPLLERSDTSVQPPEHIDRDVSTALMLALERLSPLERAAFILHDVFDMSFEELSASIGRPEATCRQLAKRARAHIADARPRFTYAQAEGERIAHAFFRAARDGDRAGLQTILAEDVRLHSDGGGKKLAALNVLAGASRVSAFFIGIASKSVLTRPIWTKAATINDHPGQISVESDGTLQTLSVEVEGDRVTAIYFTRNPDKLSHLLSELPPEVAERVTPAREKDIG